MKFDVCGFEHLHRHSNYASLLDGYASIEEYCSYSKDVNQQYVVLTEHGSCGSVAQQSKFCTKYGLTPVYGCEFYINNFQPLIKTEIEYKEFVEKCSEADKEKLRKSYHLLAVANTSKGYENLIKLSTKSWREGYGGVPRRPRLRHADIIEHKEGLVFSSCCYLSEIGQTFDREGPDAAEDMLMLYYNMLRPNFYLEIMLLDFTKQKPYDAWLIKMHDKYGIPIILTNDVHVCKQGDSKYQQYMMMTRTKNTVKDIDKALKEKDSIERFFELQDQNLWMKSEEELNQKWFSDYQDVIPYEIFCKAKSNTVEICRSAKGVQIDRSIKLPQLHNDKERLWDEMRKGLIWRGLGNKRDYYQRLKEEYGVICRKDFASYFLITKMAIDEGRAACPRLLGWGTGSEALAPGRGSAPGFLTCYVLGITDVDPIKHDLLPERFLSDARGGRQLKLEFDTDPI